jgi:hypothetical protein
MTASKHRVVVWRREASGASRFARTRSLFCRAVGGFAPRKLLPVSVIRVGVENDG